MGFGFWGFEFRVLGLGFSVRQSPIKMRNLVKTLNPLRVLERVQQGFYKAIRSPNL